LQGNFDNHKLAVPKQKNSIPPQDGFQLLLFELKSLSSIISKVCQSFVLSLFPSHSSQMSFDLVGEKIDNRTRNPSRPLSQNIQTGVDGNRQELSIEHSMTKPPSP
jgi:hypothetical protein